MLEVTIALGAHSRQISGRELVEAMQASPSLTTLVRLATSTSHPHVVHGEEGVGGESGPLGSNAKNISALTRSDPERSERLTRPCAREVEGRAQFLADVLADHRSLGWYRQVAEHAPEHIIRDALARARDLPSANVRRSRAALFTSIVRPYVTPYAHPPSKPS